MIIKFHREMEIEAFLLTDTKDLKFKFPVENGFVIFQDNQIKI